MNAHPDFIVQFDEEMFAFEAQLSNLCPAEGVDFGVPLLDQTNEVTLSLSRTVIKENITINYLKQ